MSDHIKICKDGFHGYAYNPERRKAHIIRTNRDKTYAILNKETREQVAGDFMTEDEAENWFYDDEGLEEMSLSILREGIEIAEDVRLEDIARVISEDDFLSFFAPYLFPYIGAVGLEDGDDDIITLSMVGTVEDGNLVLNPQGVSLKGNPKVEVSQEMFLHCNDTRYRGEYWWSTLEVLLALFGELPEDLPTCTMTPYGVFDDETGKKLTLLEALPRFCNVPHFNTVQNPLTLLDIFSQVEEEEMVQMFFMAYSWCRDIEAFHREAKKVRKRSHAHFLYNEIYACMDVDLRSHKDDIKPYDFNISHDFHVVGVITQKEREELPEMYEGRETQGYGVSMTPIGHYAWLPLALDNGIDIREYRTDLRQEISLLKCRRGITLLDLLDAIYMEISFHGGPEDAQKFADEMTRRVDEIKSGMAETHPFEDLVDELEEDSKETHPRETEDGTPPPKRFTRVEDMMDEWKESDKINRPTEEE